MMSPRCVKYRARNISPFMLYWIVIYRLKGPWKREIKKSISDTILALKCQSLLYCFRRFVSLFIFLSLFSEAAVSMLFDRLLFPCIIRTLPCCFWDLIKATKGCWERKARGPRPAGDDRSEARMCHTGSRGPCVQVKLFLVIFSEDLRDTLILWILRNW